MRKRSPVESEVSEEELEDMAQGWELLAKARFQHLRKAGASRQNNPNPDTWNLVSL